MRDRTGKIHYIRIFLVVLLLGWALRAFVLDAVYVPTRSMEGAVVPGDFLLIDRTGYGGQYGGSFLNALTGPAIPGFLSGTIPRRGTVIAFLLPGDLHRGADGPVPTIIKRCVATAGDSVSLEGGLLRVNGVAVSRAPADPGPFLAEGTTVRVPARGDVIDLDGRSQDRWTGVLRREGHDVSVSAGGTVLLDGRPARRYVVEHDYVFVLGDNQAVSFDSRHWGFLRADRIIGEPVLVYWSLPEEGGVGWDRIGTFIR